jgi:hypothetical protein
MNAINMRYLSMAHLSCRLPRLTPPGRPHNVRRGSFAAPLHHQQGIRRKGRQVITYPAEFPHLSGVGKSNPEECTTLCLALAHITANVIGEWLDHSTDGTRKIPEAQPNVTIYQPEIVAFGKGGAPCCTASAPAVPRQFDTSRRAASMPEAASITKYFPGTRFC